MCVGSSVSWRFLLIFFPSYALNHVRYIYITNLTEIFCLLWVILNGQWLYFFPIGVLGKSSAFIAFRRHANNYVDLMIICWHGNHKWRRLFCGPTSTSPSDNCISSWYNYSCRFGRGLADAGGRTGIRGWNARGAHSLAEWKLSRPAIYTFLLRAKYGRDVEKRKKKVKVWKRRSNKMREGIDREIE